jgi:hypothetical protein
MSVIRAEVIRIIIAVTALTAASAAPLRAASPGIQDATPPADAAEQLTFRRVFVPADRPEEWPTASEQFLPLARPEFERLIEAAADRRVLAEAGGLRLTRAQYDVKLGDDSALAGAATFQVDLVADSPRTLRLSPWNVVLMGARWLGAGTETQEAIVGVWTLEGAAAPEFGVLVEQSGELEADWLLRPNSGLRSVLEYQLELPRALRQTFVVELPPDYEASMAPAHFAGRDPVDDGSAVRWSFELGAADEYRLQIRPPTAITRRETSLPLVAVSEAYSVTPQGLDYEAEFRVQMRSSAPSEFRLDVPKSIRVTGVLIDRTPAEWRQDEANEDTVVFALPKSTSPVNVTVRGVAAVVLDESWQLPRVAAERIFWTEGTSTLWIGPALELQSITTSAGSVLNLVGVGSDDGGEAYRMQAWSSGATTEVLLTDRQPTLHTQSGVIAEFAERELAGRCHAILWATGGTLLDVAAALEPEWNLESVEATPADALAQWHVSGEGSQRRLHVQLRRSPTEQAPVRLSIAARKPLRGWAPVAAFGELDWVRFAQADSSKRLLLVKDRRGNELAADHSATDEILAFDSLSVAERGLIEEKSTGLLFSTAQLDREAMVRVVSRRARYTGEGWIELTRTETGFQHRADIVCQPTVGAVSELLVATAHPLPTDAQWTLAGIDQQLDVQPDLTAPANLDAATSAPAQYKVRLSQPHSEPIRLRVTWGEDKSTAEVISFTLPGAESWQSWATLRGNPTDVQVEPRGCTPTAALPRENSSPAEPSIVGCYRLGDDPTTPLATTPVLKSIADSPVVAGRDVTCWFCDVTTLQFADGNQTHRLSYDLEVSNSGVAELKAPNEFDIVSVRLNGAVLPMESWRTSAKLVRIPLSTALSRITLTVDFRSQRPPLRLKAVVGAPLPQTSFPVLRGQWTVSSPAPFIIESDRERQANAGWRQRLFGPLVDQPRETPSRFLGLSTAAAARPRPTGRPSGANTSPDSIVIPQGWSSLTQTFVSTPRPIELRRIDDTRAMWHVAWLMSAVAAAQLWPTRPRWIAATTAVAAIASLVLPMAWIAMPQAILLGSVAGAAMRAILLKTRDRRSAALRLGSGGALVASLFIAMLGLHATTHAADPTTAPPGVLYPIDARGKPAGADVYVPARLLNKLLPSEHIVRFGGAMWTLVDAHYQVELQQDSRANEVVCTGCTLQFDLQTFRRDVEVELPLDPEDAQWMAAAHTLDGAAAPLLWNEAGFGCTVRVVQPGRHKLLLQFVPRWRRAANENSLSLRVPPLSGATVEVIHPAGLEQVTIGPATLSPMPSQPTRTSTRVPPTDLLEVVWPKRQRSASTSLTVDQLSWLKVDPAAAHLDVRLRLSGNVSSLERLELATSPQLKLLPLPEGSPVAEVQSHPGSPNVTELKFRAPPRLPLTIPLQFQLQRSVSLGQIDFPSVRVLGAETGTRHFAVSVDRRLRLREESPVGLAPAPAADVERLWGLAEFMPVAQYAAIAGEPLWSMHIEPMPPQFDPRERMELLCTADEAHVEYSAAIGDVDGDILVHRIAVTPEIEVTAVTVTLGAEESPAALRWARPRPDQICVFLSRPLNAAHMLRVTGRVPYGDSRRLPMPHIGLESTRTRLINVDVRRTSEVLVEWQKNAPPTPAPATAGIGGGPGLSVGKYTVARDLAKMPVLQIVRNDVRLSADAVLTLNLMPAEPVAALLVYGEVSRGIVDRMQLEVSKNWRGPFLVDANAQATVTSLPRDKDWQTIMVQLPKPVEAGGEFVVRLTGPVVLESDGRVRFPNIRLLDATEKRVFLALPQTPSTQTAEWTLSGLQRQGLPESLAEAFGQSPKLATYRVQRDRFVAEQRVFPDALRSRAIRLAETRVALDSNGRWSALTLLLVQPGGASNVAVRLPDGAELIHATVDDWPIASPGVKGGELQLPPGSRYLPRIIALAYQMQPGDDGSQFDLQVPRVLVDGRPLTPARSLWQIEGEAAPFLAAEDAGTRLSQAAFDMVVRREQLSAVADASPLALQLPPWELQQWFWPWLRRLDGDAAALDANSAATWIKLRERIASVEGATGRLNERPIVRELDRYPSAPAAWYQGGPDGKLTLVRGSNGIGAGRWLLALGIAGLWGVAWRSPHKIDPALALLRRWPAVLGIVAGMLWWAFLTPSLLGVAILALSLGGILKSRQERRAAMQKLNPHDEPDDAAAARVAPG